MIMIGLNTASITFRNRCSILNKRVRRIATLNKVPMMETKTKSIIVCHSSFWKQLIETNFWKIKITQFLNFCIFFFPLIFLKHYIREENERGVVQKTVCLSCFIFIFRFLKTLAKEIFENKSHFWNEDSGGSELSA